MAGTVGSTVAAADGLVTSSGPLIWNLSPVNSGSPHSFIFADSASLPQLILASMVYAKDRGWTRIAAITTTDTSGVTGLKSLKAALKQPALSSIKVVANETFNPSAVTVATQLAVIKAANPQAVFEWSTGTPTTTFFQDYSQAGMTNIPVITGYGNAIPKVLERFGSSLPTYLYFANERFELGPSALTGAAAATTKAFYDEMKAQHSSVSAIASLSWDPAMILVHALRHLGVNATPTQLKKYIENIHGFQGANGVYNFSPTNHRGYDPTSLVMTQWVKQSNKFTVSKITYPKSLGG
jgi:branched-chain amino acid transport system substrate-binding protein